jgi:hypothetical protein
MASGPISRQIQRNRSGEEGTAIVLVNPDQSVRARYEARAAASDPGVEERAAQVEPAPPAREKVTS